MNWNQLNLDEKLKTLEDVRKKERFELFIIEKDWWVVQTLRMVSQMDIFRPFFQWSYNHIAFSIYFFIL